MATTRRITVKVHERLWDGFVKQTEALFLKRDAFLNHMIRLETPYLASEMKGKHLSPEARRYIASEFKKLRPVPVNIVLDEDVAKALDQVVSEGNLVRDGFINRLIMWLRSHDTQLKRHSIPTTLDSLGFGSSSRGLEGMPVSPLKAMEAVRDDPFYYIRDQLDEQGGGLYTSYLPSNLTGLNCYLDDEFVPGTDAYKANALPTEDEI